MLNVTEVSAVDNNIFEGSFLIFGNFFVTGDTYVPPILVIYNKSHPWVSHGSASLVYRSLLAAPRNKI